MTAQDITADIAASLGLKTPTGALISDLDEASPALSAGLKSGDVITAVNGHSVRDASELRFRLATLALGEKAELTYKRGGEDAKTTLQPSCRRMSPPARPSKSRAKIH